MLKIDHVNLANLDLNLLVAFDALLTEGSVTRAAAKVGLGQSAMSHALARLRTTLGDELFTRGPDGMRPTPRALDLAAPIQSALAQIAAAVRPDPSFDPATAERSFTISAPDGVEVLLMPRLVSHLREVAPGVRLLLRGMDRFRILEDLDAARTDLGIGVIDDGQTHHKRRLLHRENYLCIFNPALVDAETPISLEDYLRFPHVLTSLVESAHGVVDVALAKIGRTRTIALTSPRFNSLPFVVAQAPVVATMHAEVARYFAAAMGLTLSPAPVLLPDVEISMVWHASYDRDPAHQWLRETIRKLMTASPPPSLNLWLSRAEKELPV